MGPSRETDLAGETRPTGVTVGVVGKMDLAGETDLVGETDLAGDVRPTVATAGEADVSKVTAGVAGDGDLTGVTAGVAGVTKVAA
ncbi:hypothetical protein GHT06_022589 [Daphnia sinensis]|uniref:Uncharacterized protein n=1 Tax=Daphnia sinensis TaxID=1820382 RepID=A0AAD5KYB7_9CRUS|nr:hypothetical protein GHT06_022589 [Daphnia sinensis]